MSRILMSLVVFLISQVLQAQLLPLSLEVTTNKYVFPGQEFDMYLSYRDAQNTLVTDFTLNHEKLNHTIIVSKDLDTFAHVHPEQQQYGTFMIPINSYKGVSVDNSDASQAVAKPGTYYVFSEVAPTAVNKVTLVRATMSAHGKENILPLTLDGFWGNASTKYFKATSDAGQYGDTYRVTLTVDKMPGMLHFYFKIEEWMLHGGGHYMTVTNLENWLGMPGHGILISEFGDDVQSKEFRHMHAMTEDPHSGGHQHSREGNHDHHPAPADTAISGENLQMMLSGQDMTTGGTYKLWGQFKHKGKVVTFPFVLSL